MNKRKASPCEKPPTLGKKNCISTHHTISSSELLSIYFKNQREHSPFIIPKIIDPESEVVWEEAGNEEKIELFETNALENQNKLNEEELQDIITHAYLFYKIRHKKLKMGLNYLPQKKKHNRIPTKSEITDAKVEKAVELIQNKFSTKIISQHLLLPLSTIKTIQGKLKKGENPVLEPSKRKTKIKPAYLDFLDNFLSNPENCTTSLQGLQRILQEKFPLDSEKITVSLIYRMVKSLNFTWKRTYQEVADRNSVENKADRKKKIIELCELFDNNKKFIYLDETGFGKDFAPIYGYGKKGKRLNIKTINKLKRVNVIAAMTENEILGYQLLKGGVAAGDYGAFLILLLKNYPDIQRDLNNYVFFMDNLSIHTAKKLSNLYKAINVCFNATYSPFLNPIEELFGLWKQKFRKLKTENEEELFKNIILSSKSINETQLTGFVKHSYSFYSDCYEQKDIL